MRARVALIGVGNPWRHDDGIGWAVVAAAGRRLGNAVDVVESDGEPSRLLEAWYSLDLAVVVDGVAGGASPGAIHVWAEPFDLPAASPAAGSHAMGIAETVALGRALDRLPERLVVVGIEVDDTSTGHGLLAAVGAAVDEAVDVITDLVTHRGRCECGAVSYFIVGPLRPVWNCHCHRCRRFTGHHMAATAASPDNVHFISDATLTWYAPNPTVAYGFCSTCGSSLFWRAGAQPDHLSICAGSLDQPTGLQTSSAWWMAEHGDYHTPEPNVDNFDRES